MYPEVTITVGSSYWRCLTCRTLNRRTASIDQHLHLQHAELLPDDTRSLTSKLASHAADSYSDSEIDKVCSHKQVDFANSGFLSMNKPHNVNLFNHIAPLTELSRGYHGNERVKTVKKKSQSVTVLKDCVSDASPETITESISQFPSATSEMVADENQHTQSRVGVCHQNTQCLKTVKQKYSKKTHSRVTKNTSRNLSVHHCDWVDEQVSKKSPVNPLIRSTPAMQLRGRCSTDKRVKQQKVFAKDENTFSIPGEDEGAHTDILTTLASDDAQLQRGNTHVKTGTRRKTDTGIHKSDAFVLCRDKVSHLSSFTHNVSSVQLSGGCSGTRLAELENDESKPVDSKSVAGRRRQMSVAVLSKKKLATGILMNVDSATVKRLRPGRKAAKRKDLSKREREMMKQKYVQNVDINPRSPTSPSTQLSRGCFGAKRVKDFIQYSESASHDQPVKEGEKTNDTGTVQMNSDTESIMQDQQFLNTMGSPASQDFSSMTSEHVEAGAETGGTDLQTCTGLVPSVSDFEVNEHNLHTNLLNTFNSLSPTAPSTQLSGGHCGAKRVNSAAPATQLNGEHGGAMWVNSCQGTDDSSSLRTGQHVPLAEDSSMPLAGENTPVTRDIVSLDARITQPQSLCTHEPCTQEFQQSKGTFGVGATEAETLDSVDKFAKSTNITLSSVKPGVPGKFSPHIFECRICRAKFSSFENLSVHVNKMSSFGVTQCKICSKLFHGMYYINLHIFGEHEQARQCICFECGDVFSSMEQLEKHLCRHSQMEECSLTQMRFHDCRICGKEVLSGFAVMQSHYYARHKAYLCFDCYLRSDVVFFMDPVAAKEHRQAHETVCDICLKHFPSTEQRLMHSFQHANSEVEDGTGMLCEKCGKWCANSTVALLHDKWHRLQQVREKREKDARAGFACLQCDKVYRSKRSLDRHTAHSHSKNRAYKFHCEFCGKGVDSKNYLQDHIALHHLGVKRYACQHCDLRFVCRPTLKRHVLREHAKDRQYRCEFCGECFCEKIKLERHMFVHTGKARFMCEHCGKGFQTSSEFKNHMSVHAETRNFICQSCGQDYKRKEHLRRHLKNCKKS